MRRFQPAPRRLALTGLALALAYVPCSSRAASDSDEPVSLSLRGYGIANYANYDWETFPEKRATTDLERLVLYPGVRFTDRVRVEAEIEFEHGGTGVTKEFDVFEEFGEFETEVEAGGEILLEQLHVEFAITESQFLRIGRFKLPVGLAGLTDEPGEYFTTTRSEGESNVIPVNWYENGLLWVGRVPGTTGLHFSAAVVNGLDSTGFSSATWVARGHQTRFEQVNAENFAVAGRLSYRGVRGLDVSVSGYTGDSADNRPKPDLDVSAVVTIGAVSVEFERGPLTFRAVGLHGTLENSDRVSAANRNLSNNLNVKRTPVGAAATVFGVELAYDVLSLFNADLPRLDVYGRLDDYDSMAEVEGTVFDNARWERTSWNVGAVLHPIDDVVAKIQYRHRTLGTETENTEKTFSLGIGFEFDAGTIGR